MAPASNDASRPAETAPTNRPPYEQAARPSDTAPAAPPQQPPASPAASTAQPAAPGTGAQRSPSEPSPPDPRAASEPGFLARGNIRRRARFLRAARELAYRDLGGLVFDLHRFAQRNDEVVQAKLATLSRIDAELRSLEEALKRRTPLTVLRQAGISACPRCAAIHGSFDRFCPACGLPVKPDARPIAPAPPAPPAPDASTRPADATPAPPAHTAVSQPTEAFVLPDPEPAPRTPDAGTPHAGTPDARTPDAGTSPPESAAGAAPGERGSEDGKTEVIGPGSRGQRR